MRFCYRHSHHCFTAEDFFICSPALGHVVHAHLLTSAETDWIQYGSSYGRLQAVVFTEATGRELELEIEEMVLQRARKIIERFVSLHHHLSRATALILAHVRLGIWESGEEALPQEMQCFLAVLYKALMELTQPPAHPADPDAGQRELNAPAAAEGTAVTNTAMAASPFDPDLLAAILQSTTDRGDPPTVSEGHGYHVPFVVIPTTDLPLLPEPADQSEGEGQLDMYAMLEMPHGTSPTFQPPMEPPVTTDAVEFPSSYDSSLNSP